MNQPAPPSTTYDVVILGGGAAGLMCAATAGYRNRNVLIIDHANRVGKKILMSGGGRCNFTNRSISPKQYLSNNPHFCKSALSRYTSSDFIDLVERHGLHYFEKERGQLFCQNSAKDLLNILLTECEFAGVNIATHCSLLSVNKTATGFLLETSLGKINTEAFVVASGGLSIPTMGATGKGYELAKQFNLPCVDRRAGLVPFTLSGRWLEVAQSISGVSLDVTVECAGHSFHAPLLFTHRGLSGPAMLQISSYWSPSTPITINFLPQIDLKAQLKIWHQQGKKSELKNILGQWLPKRFVQRWLSLPFHEQSYCIENRAACQYDKTSSERLCKLFQAFTITPSGTEGYRTAEVTVGGVDTNSISSKTFECKEMPGLYFIGEVLDVTGWLGGYNFQWAWSSGYCAGLYV